MNSSTSVQVFVMFVYKTNETIRVLNFFRHHLLNYEMLIDKITKDNVP